MCGKQENVVRIVFGYHAKILCHSRKHLDIETVNLVKCPKPSLILMKS